MLNRKTVLALVPVLFVVVVAALGQTTSTNAIYTTTSTLPPVGLAPGETAQVNVVNTANVSVAYLGSVSASTAPSCTGSIAFLNATGAMIGTATAFTVGSGQIFGRASLRFGRRFRLARGHSGRDRDHGNRPHAPAGAGRGTQHPCNGRVAGVRAPVFI